MRKTIILFKPEIFKELDRLAITYKRKLRGLNEIETNEPGRELINDAAQAMKSLTEFYKRYTAYLELMNIELNMLIEQDNEIRREHALLKQSFNASVMLDEIGQELKKKILEKRARGASNEN